MGNVTESRDYHVIRVAACYEQSALEMRTNLFCFVFSSW